MRVLLFRGKGFMAKAIQWQTRSQYSHVGILIDGKVYESQAPDGVRVREPYGDYDEFKFLGENQLGAFDESIVRAFLVDKLGTKYDYLMVARFLSRRPAKENNRYFCSELVMDAFRHVGISLLNAPSHHVSPRDVAMSPLLVRVK